MFKVRENGETLTGTQADFFHILVAKILFVRFRSNPDLKTAMDFLTTPVRNPDGDDYKNPAHEICYIRVTRGMELTL